MFGQQRESVVARQRSKGFLQRGARAVFHAESALQTLAMFLDVVGHKQSERIGAVLNDIAVQTPRAHSDKDESKMIK